MDRKRRIAFSLFFVVLVGALFVAQIGPGALGFGPEKNGVVPIAEIEENPQPYIGEQITIEGWYQGGLVRDADPQCATTREGVQAQEYSSVFIDAPEDKALYTGVKYRFTGTLYAELEGRSVPNNEPVFVPEDVERIGGEHGNCTVFGNTTAE
ncbi:hypothetical protein GJ633_04330 [Halorubrum sp. CBA1125]|uniref:hypothetical protein n=1 Tax=Halorubrum sp. CBA1125 TaxID=2668072 RepID=UPI0012E78144|nr:hypothetical protein [Halorubrum sp. CBA1125]MUW13975.1 hypothetical protein [Halorubrum sp. CBA1125]